MTLFKQIALLVTLVFLLIVVTTTVGDFRRSGSFLEGQLQTSAQDMATTLGIAISNTSTASDEATYETLFNAVFDSGYYSSIELVAPDGTVIHRKDRMLEIEGVPDWFISMVPLWPATGKTQVMQGWVPLGTLQLTLHPGYVYASLYKNLVATMTWFLVLFSVGLGLLWLFLHRLLMPLDDVKKQANAIHNNKFVIQSELPRTIELRTVVEAMNRMVEKVHTVFDDQDKTLTRYQKLLYEDELTGLGNRKYFMSQLEQAQSEEASFHGSMAVIKIHNLEYVREHSGYEKSDAIVKELADVLKQDANLHANEYCARLSDNEFALLLPAGALPVVDHIKGLFEIFKSRSLIESFKDDILLIAGVSSVQVGGGVGETLADSDFALSQAAASGSYSVYEKTSSNISLPQGKMQWRSCLERSIAEEKLFLVGQKVLDTNGVPVHQEVFVRLKNEDGQTVPAGMFMPMANALDLGEHIDRVVFKLIKALSKESTKIPVALNLTESVFTHADALVEFNQLLSFFQETSAKLCIEASHTILEKYPLMCAEVAETVRKAGHIFGVDNLNLGLPLQSLQSVRPDYVKLNANILYDMTKGEIPAVYQALRTLTKAMDIRLIAVGVDTQEVRDHLEALGVGTMQGNLLSGTEEII